MHIFLIALLCPSRYQELNNTIPAEVSQLISDALSELHSFSTTTTDSSDGEEGGSLKVWLVGLAFITLCSFSAPLGLAALPCLSKTAFERVMAFLIALGIGTLSGSCVFIMIPKAFGMDRLDKLFANAGIQYSDMALIMISSIYAFFFVDRILQYVLEFRRRRTRSRVHVLPTVNVKPAGGLPKMVVTECDAETTPGAGAPYEDGFRAPSAPRQASPASNRSSELEMAVVNNVVARSLSSKRRVARVSGIDDVEFACREGSRAGGREVHQNHSPATRSLSDVTRHTTSHHSSSLDNPNTLHASEEVLNRINKDISHLVVPQSHSRRSLTSSKDEDRVSVVRVDVEEKRVVNSSDMEIGSVAYIIIIGSSANNFFDAMGMGAAFSDKFLHGVTIGIAAFSQQFPQEVGTLAIIASSGLGIRRTLLVSFIPAALSYIGFAIGVAANGLGSGYEAYIFAISAGMYLYVFLGTLIPEIRESTAELIKQNLSESVLYTALQIVGITGGLCFIFYMNKYAGSLADSV